MRYPPATPGPRTPTNSFLLHPCLLTRRRHLGPLPTRACPLLRMYLIHNLCDRGNHFRRCAYMHVCLSAHAPPLSSVLQRSVCLKASQKCAIPGALGRCARPHNIFPRVFSACECPVSHNPRRNERVSKTVSNSLLCDARQFGPCYLRQ